MCQLASVVLSFASGLWENTLLVGHSGANDVLKASALLHVQQHNESSSHVNRAVIKSALHCWGMIRNNGNIDVLLHSSERPCHLSVSGKKLVLLIKFTPGFGVLVCYVSVLLCMEMIQSQCNLTKWKQN